MSNLLNDTSLRTLIIKPGETIVLPRGAVVRSVVADGNIDVQSSCDNLPDTSYYKCWRFIWEKVDSGYNDAYFTYFEVGGVKYPLTNAGSADDARTVILGTTVNSSNTYDNGGNYLATVLPQVLPSGMIKDIINRGGTAVNPKCLKISIPEALGEPKLYWVNPSLGNVLQLSAMLAEENQCACPE